MPTSSFRTLAADAIDGVSVYKNYIKNGQATVTADGWSTYADAAAAMPVDGTGGSPTVTWVRSTSSPLTGDASFLFSKDAANRQGQGVSYLFTIDQADDNGGLFSAPLTYSPNTGTYAGGSATTDSDLTVYVVSLEFGTVIQPSYYKLQATVTGKTAKATPVFQLPVSAGGGSARQFRLCIHVATTSASAYTVKFDEIKVSPQPQANVQYGSFKLPTIQKFISGSGTYTRPDGVSYIKVKMVGGGGGGGGSGTYAGSGQTVGSDGGSTTFGSLTCTGGTGGCIRSTGSAAAGGTATLGMGSGVALTGASGNGSQISNSSEAASGGDGGSSPFGGGGGGGGFTQNPVAGAANTGSGGGGGGTHGNTAADASGGGGASGGYIDCIVQSPASTYSYSVGSGGAGGSAGTSESAGAAGGSGVIVVEEFYTPTEAGLNPIISMSTDKTTGSHTSNGSWQDVAAWDAPLMDRGGNFNATTGVYTVNEPGDYDVYGTVAFVSGTPGHRAVRIYYNNTTAYGGGEVNAATNPAAGSLAFAKTIPCKSGDTIRIQCWQNSGGSLAYNGTYNSLSICKRATSQTTSTMTAGMVMAFARTTAPTGWLSCDGSAVSRTQYASLFSAIGVTYGSGDGSTTFNLPDCRGVFLRGAGTQTISGIAHTGTQGTTQNDQIQGHNHSISDPGHAHNMLFATSTGGSTYMTYTGAAANTAGVAYAATTSAGTGVTVTSPSSDGVNGTPRTGNETRPANISLLYCISY